MPPRIASRNLLAGLALAALPILAFTGVIDLAGVSTQRIHPESDGLTGIDPVVTASIPASPALQPTVAGNLAALREGLEALSRADIDAARAARDTLPANSLDRHILAWTIAVGGAAPSGEIAAATRMLDGWPGMAILARNHERALTRENLDPRTVVQTFGATPPLTWQGSRFLARARLALGDAAGARAALAGVWRTEKFDAAEETAIIREFGHVLSAADHRARMERMLYAARANSAERVARLAGAEALNKAWSAVLRRDKSAAKLLEQVPKAERGAGYFYARAKHLRWAGKFDQAAALMLEAPTDATALIDPDAWWVERRVLARELLDIGEPKTAYRIVAAHSAESPVMIADAEFHAGWLALRHTGDPTTAARHFARIADIAEGSISLSRAYYWLGRAAEAGGPGDAQAYYKRAASHGAAFYGQLAAAKLGRGGIPIGLPEPSAADRRHFESREAVRAILRLEYAGFAARADLLYRELARQLTNPGELALLASMAATRGNHYLALRVGKIAASRGIQVGALAHPTGAIPVSADISGAGMALAYAIARQESEFRVEAISGAGAKGLLQLMPDTARDMAKKAGMAFSAHKLTSDAAYNATLGAEFLSEQLGRFSGSYVLTFAGYNAGPSRVVDWIRRYGDPRGKPVEEVVDWIERIPFTETRHYVQRVMENYQVYKMRLTGRFDIAADLVEGR